MVSSLWLELLTGEKPFKTAPLCRAASVQQPQQQPPDPAAATAAAASSPPNPVAAAETAAPGHLPAALSTFLHLLPEEEISGTTRLSDTSPAGTKGQCFYY